MSRPFHLLATGTATLSVAASPASRPAQGRLFMDDDKDSLAGTADYGLPCCALCSYSAPNGLSLRMLVERPSGLTRSRAAWRLLATEFPTAPLPCRVRALVRLILAGGCSGLPTVTARDWKSPGRADHPRLKRSRGEPLPETLGFRPSPQLCEWMMGFPPGWTEANG